VASHDRVDVEIDGRRLSLSHLDKVLFPSTGFTKGALLDYYRRIAPVMLPHLGDRPVTLRRYPNGVEDQGFFEKHVPAHAPKWVRSVTVPSSTNGGADVAYPMIGDLPSLLWAANLDSIEFHVPLWHAGGRRKLPAPPDHVVFDLDPGPGTDIVDCCRVAVWIASEVEGSQWPGSGIYPKTSGSKGLQLYLPVSGRPTWERVKEYAHHMATTLASDHPDAVVSSMRRMERHGKVLIDWSQNSPSKTTVAAYSVRARPEPSVSTPLAWEEVAKAAGGGDPNRFRFLTDQVVARVTRGGDRFAPLAR